MPLTIILVNPEIPENVGFVVRSMKCFNLQSLIVVGRKKYPEFSKAHKTGTSAIEILENAEFVATLKESIGPFHTVLGFSKRHREMSPRRLAKMEYLIPSLDFTKNTALVFGCESQGLSKEDCLLMDRVVKINLPNPSLSLNLSHAVTLVLQEIWAHSLVSCNPFKSEGGKGEANKSDSKTDKEISFSDKEYFFAELKDYLLDNRIISGEKTGAKIIYLRELWHRVRPSKPELDFLLGLLNASRKTR